MTWSELCAIQKFNSNLYKCISHCESRPRLDNFQKWKFLMWEVLFSLRRTLHFNFLSLFQFIYPFCYQQMFAQNPWTIWNIQPFWQFNFFSIHNFPINCKKTLQFAKNFLLDTDTAGTDPFTCCRNLILHNKSHTGAMHHRHVPFVKIYFGRIPVQRDIDLLIKLYLKIKSQKEGQVLRSEARKPPVL